MCVRDVNIISNNIYCNGTTSTKKLYNTFISVLNIATLQEGSFLQVDSLNQFPLD